jgi:hypothetical protein
MTHDDMVLICLKKNAEHPLEQVEVVCLEIRPSPNNNLAVKCVPAKILGFL